MTKVRAVIFDVYRTLLEVRPPPADAEARWRLLAGAAGDTLAGLSARCREIVAADHAVAQARGVRFPEVVWPDVMRRALPGFAVTDDFLHAHMQLLRGVRLMPGAANFLGACADKGLVLGIASNAQHYTLRELADALSPAELSPGIFDPGLTLWSWQLGFSKPDPHVFQMLSARLAHRGIRGGEILMIGDRLDNDIEPARAFGWRAEHLAVDAGGWAGLRARLFGEP